MTGRLWRNHFRVANKAAFFKKFNVMSDPLKPLFGGRMPAFDGLVRRAAQARSLTEKVRGELPAGLGEHVLSAARRDTDLVVIVDSAAWAARVRYAGRRLKAQLEAGGEPPIDRIRIKVRGVAESG